jgi:transcriptional pleiotropic regulator of transition state genes
MPACIFCGNFDGITYFKGKTVCYDCIGETTALKKAKADLA